MSTYGGNGAFLGSEALKVPSEVEEPEEDLSLVAFGEIKGFAGFLLGLCRCFISLLDYVLELFVVGGELLDFDGEFLEMEIDQSVCK